MNDDADDYDDPPLSKEERDEIARQKADDRYWND